MTHPEMRSPAPRVNAEDRAKGNRSDAFSTIAAAVPEADFSAGFIARRYRLPLPVARVVASLARIGGRLS